VQLELYRHGLLTESIFVPFYRLPPATKSLRVTAPALMSSRIFDLILSFPLLEDLAVRTYFGSTVDSGDGLSIAVQPPGPPAFTGSLELYLKGGMKSFTRRLLSPAGGIHFQKLSLTWRGREDSLLITALVEECHYTLRSLDITSLEVDKTRRYGFSARIAKRRMGHRGAPNDHFQTSRSSTDHDLCVLPPDYRRCRR
jgi:hypothetical protein